MLAAASFYGTLLATVFVAAANLRRGLAARFAGLLFLALWIECMVVYLAGNACHPGEGRVWAEWNGWITDVIAGAACVFVWVIAPSKPPAIFLLWLFVFFAVQLLGHVGFYYGQFDSLRELQDYLWRLNVVQLLLTFIGPRQDEWVGLEASWAPRRVRRDGLVARDWPRAEKASRRYRS